ncbi:MAG: single-stranded DNA-binding protein [Acidobacteriota bacterium]|nr:single-stranded DNA-binding protein [Acidobacteriota bacterium]
MEILNQVILAGNLTDRPTVNDAGGRQFVRARLAQNWYYDSQGRTVEHRQFLPLTFFGESAIVAKSLEKGDNIHVTGQLIRREPRVRPDGSASSLEAGTVFEIHVLRVFRISASSKANAAIHQNEIRRTNDAKQIPAFIQESILDWPI